MHVRRRQRARAIDEHRRERIDGRDGASGLHRAGAWERIRWRGVGACPAAAPGLGAPPVHVAGESPSCIEAASGTQCLCVSRRARLRSIRPECERRALHRRTADRQGEGRRDTWVEHAQAGGFGRRLGRPRTLALYTNVWCGALRRAETARNGLHSPRHPLAALSVAPREPARFLRAVPLCLRCHAMPLLLPSPLYRTLQCPFRLCNVRFGARRSAAKPWLHCRPGRARKRTQGQRAHACLRRLRCVCVTWHANLNDRKGRIGSTECRKQLLRRCGSLWMRALCRQLQQPRDSVVVNDELVPTQPYPLYTLQLQRGSGLAAAN
jgi:hypothetical protein